MGIRWLFHLPATRSLDGCRAVRAVGIAGTKSSTTAAAEVLLTRGRCVSLRARNRGPGDCSTAVIDGAFIIEVAAVTSAEGDVSDAVDDPKTAENKTPVSNSTKDEKTSKQIDNTTTKRGNHAGEGSEDGGGLKLDANEKKSKNHEVCGKHTHCEVGSVSFELHTAREGIVNSFIVRATVCGNKRQNTVDKQYS